jgi:hypothetical protein
MEHLSEFSALGGALLIVGAILFSSWAEGYNNRRWEALVIAKKGDRMSKQQKRADRARELQREVARVHAIAKKNLRQKAKAKSKN